MKPEDQAWQKLVTAARRVSDDRDTTAPYGFATRVAAVAMAAPERTALGLFERFSWQALGIAGLLATAAFTAAYSSTETSLADEMLSDENVVAALFETS